MPEDTRGNDRVEVYKARDGWRWRRVAANGKVLSESSDSYQGYDYTKKIAAEVNPSLPITYKKVVDLY